MLEKTLENPLDSKDIKPINPKGNQPWTITGRTDAEAEALILWPPEVKSQLTGKDSWRVRYYLVTEQVPFWTAQWFKSISHSVKSKYCYNLIEILENFQFLIYEITQKSSSIIIPHFFCSSPEEPGIKNLFSHFLWNENFTVN